MIKTLYTDCNGATAKLIKYDDGSCLVIYYTKEGKETRRTFTKIDNALETLRKLSDCWKRKEIIIT